MRCGTHRATCTWTRQSHPADSYIGVYKNKTEYHELVKKNKNPLFLGLLLYASLLTGCVAPAYVRYDQKAIDRFYDYTCFVIDTSEKYTLFEDPVPNSVAGHSLADELSAALRRLPRRRLICSPAERSTKRSYFSRIRNRTDRLLLLRIQAAARWPKHQSPRAIHLHRDWMILAFSNPF